MVKSILPYICVAVITGCTHSGIQNDLIVSNIPVEPLPAKIYSVDCVRSNAESFVGVKEKNGNNIDFTDKRLKDLLVRSGWKPGQAWCSFITKGILDECNVPNKINGWSPTSFNRSDVIYTDGEFKQDYSQKDVLVMSLSYLKHKNNPQRFKGIGHAGIVDRVVLNRVYTWEGNTNDEGSSEGDGFYKKIRPLNSNLHITRYEKH